jgi:photosystem II stability/assembly factor-like uncharacterized protein
VHYLKKASYFGFICLLAAALWYPMGNRHFFTHSKPDAQFAAEEGKAAIYDAFAFDQLKKKDPATGTIPADAVYQAFLALKNRGLYAETNGSIRDGSGWESVNDFFPSLAVTKITFDPNQTNTFYFCTGEGWFNADAVRGAGVFKSIDGGETWEQLASTASSIFQYCQDIDVHPLTGDVYVATRSGGLQRSTDGGISWQKVLGSGAGSSRNSICDVEITSDGGVFVGIGIFDTDGIYYSPSGDSATYNKQTVGLPGGGFYRIELAVAKSDPDIAYAIPCSTNYMIQGIYRTDDRGATWQATGLPGDNLELAASQAWYDLIIEVDPNDANTVVAGGLHLWRSEDGATTWQQLSTGRLDSNLIRYVHVDQHAIVFRNSNEVYFGNDGGIYKSTNFTSDNPVIYSRNDGYNITQYYAASMSAEAGNPFLVGGTQDNGSQAAYNPGITAFKPVSGADGAFCAVNPLNTDLFYTTTQFRRMYRFDNGGFELPDTITNDYLEDDDVLFINPFEMDPVNPENLYMASAKSLWRLKNASTATGADWEKACAFGGIISAVSVSTYPEDIVFMGRYSSNSEPVMLQNASTTDSNVLVVGLDPAGMIPDAPGFGAGRYCSSIAVDINDANHLLVTYSNYGINSIWETDNALSASPVWTSVEGDFPDVPVNWAAIHPNNPDVAYIATELGVFYTNNLNGTSTEWLPSTYLPIVRTDMLRIRPSDGTIMAATHGRGIWEAQIDPSGINNDLIWIERGPNNIGGRTRAIMIDPNDPSGQTIWAGGISGGLWKTTNIDGLTGVQEMAHQPEISVFPNPVHGDVFYANLAAFNGRKINAELISMATGQIVQRFPEQFVGGNGTVAFPIHNLKTGAGMYLLRVSDGRKSAVARLMLL